jgi:histone H3/H4
VKPAEPQPAPVSETQSDVTATPAAAVGDSQSAPVDTTTVASAGAATATANAADTGSGSHTSAARVRLYMDKKIMNRAINEEQKRMKSALTQLEAARKALESGHVSVTSTKETPSETPDAPPVTEEVVTLVPITPEQRAEFQATVNTITPVEMEYILKIEALRHERIRFSSESSGVLGTVCDQIVGDLVNHAIRAAKKANKKIIKIQHIHEPGVESLPLYALISQLPSFQANAAMFSNMQKEEELESLRKRIRLEVWKEFRTRYNQAVSRKKKVAPMVLPIKTPDEHTTTAASTIRDGGGSGSAEKNGTSAGGADEPTPSEAVDTDSENGKTNFVFYVMQECKSIIASNPAYAGVRFSTDAKHYLSDLIIEFIKRVSKQIGFSATNRKTINGVAILNAVEKLLVDGRQPVETISYKPALVVDPVAKEAENKKRKDQKAAGVEYKFDAASLPKVQGYVAFKTVTYPDSGYSRLLEAIEAKKLAAKPTVEPAGN